MRLGLGLLFVAGLAACRIETAAPQGANSAALNETAEPAGDVWVYTSMYRHVVDAFEPLLKEQLPKVTVHWYQAGSEKVSARLDAELAAGGTQCDLLLTSDPFLYERLKREKALARFASVNGQRVPRTLVDPDSHFSAVRLSTMVLVHRADSEAPKSFAELADPKFKDAVVLGDPLTSGTAFTWAVFVDRLHGSEFFARLRANGARVAGGNAAVKQKLESGEAKAGVLLLENALGSSLKIVWPDDKAVLIPGHVALFKDSKNRKAAQAVIDVLLSEEGQKRIVKGDMHGVDPRLEGPQGEPGLDALLERTQPWSQAALAAGLDEGGAVKARFSGAFSK